MEQQEYSIWRSEDKSEWELAPSFPVRKREDTDGNPVILVCSFEAESWGQAKEWFEEYVTESRYEEVMRKELENEERE